MPVTKTSSADWPQYNTFKALRGPQKETIELKMKPRLLDLFCCAGGCSKGYVDAGFEVVGVDIEPQPKYPYHFIQGDALEVAARIGREFDVIHASPPCQRYSSAANTQDKDKYPDLIAPTRNLLKQIGRPYVIENVVGAPLENPVLLCGTMFGIRMYRHRLFETSFECRQPPHPPHHAPQVKMGRAPKAGEYIQAVGHFSGVPEARREMGLPWMGQKELAQAIPPAYTRFVGHWALRCAGIGQYL